MSVPAEVSVPLPPLEEGQVYAIVGTTRRGHLMREATVRHPAHVAAEVARTKGEPGVDEVRVEVRASGVDADLRRA